MVSNAIFGVSCLECLNSAKVGGDWLSLECSVSAMAGGWGLGDGFPSVL